MAWQDFLNTPGAKEYYIRSEQFLDIDAPKSSKVYRNAYRYLDLIATGKRSGQESEYKAIVDDAKRLDRLTRQPLPPEAPPTPTGRTPTRLYIPGTSYVRFSEQWERRRNFAVDLPDEDDTRLANQAILDLARAGRYVEAIEEAFAASGLNMNVAREKMAGDVEPTIGRYGATKTYPGLPLRVARDNEVRPVY